MNATIPKKKPWTAVFIGSAPDIPAAAKEAKATGGVTLDTTP